MPSLAQMTKTNKHCRLAIEIDPRQRYIPSGIHRDHSGFLPLQTGENRIILLHLQQNRRPGQIDRGFLMLALGLNGTKDASTALLAEFRRTRTPALRSPQMLGLGLCRMRAAVPDIIKRVRRASLTNTEGRDELAYGALGIGLIGDPRGIETVEHVLDTYADPVVRESAAVG